MGDIFIDAHTGVSELMEYMESRMLWMTDDQKALYVALQTVQEELERSIGANMALEDNVDLDS